MKILAHNRLAILARRCAPALAVLLVATSSTAQARTETLVCIGDSITEGTRPYWDCYRGYLWDMLVVKHHCIDFIGTRRGVLDVVNNKIVHVNSNKHAKTDQDHFAWSAKESDFVRAELDKVTLVADIALVHLGTNDVLNGVFASKKPDAIAAQVKGALQGLRDRLKKTNSSVKIYFATIIPIAPIGAFNFDKAVAKVNAAITSLNDGPKKVFVVDQHKQFLGKWNLYHPQDFVHLNATGAARMAQTWFDAIKGSLVPQNPKAGDACLREYGRGCGKVDASPDSRLGLTARARPTLGQTLKFEVTRLESGASVLLAFATKWNDQNIGIGDCRVFVPTQPDIILAVGPAAAGKLGFALQIPTSASFLGANFYVQAIGVKVNPLTLTLSNGVWIRIGN